MSFWDKLVDVAKGAAPSVIGGALAGGPVGAGVGLVKAVAAQVLGKSGESEVSEQEAERIIQDPHLYMEFKARLQEVELGKLKEHTKQLETVNETMQAESKSERWPQYSWRPANGFAYPAAVILVYFVLPLIGRSVPAVPELIWTGWLVILGVAVWDRGKAKRAEAGEHKPGLLQGAIQAIQGRSS